MFCRKKDAQNETKIPVALNIFFPSFSFHFQIASTRIIYNILYIFFLLLLNGRGSSSFLGKWKNESLDQREKMFDSFFLRLFVIVLMCFKRFIWSQILRSASSFVSKILQIFMVMMMIMTMAGYCGQQSR